MFEQFIDVLFNLIFQPGSSLQLIPYINFTILLLIGLLFVAGWKLDIGKIHLYILSFFALGLFFSVNWFYYEFNKIKNQQQQTSDEAISTTNTTVTTDNKTGKKNKKQQATKAPVVLEKED